MKNIQSASITLLKPDLKFNMAITNRLFSCYQNILLQTFMKCVFSLESDLLHRLCERLLCVFGCLYVCFNSITRCGRQTTKYHSQTSNDLTYKHDIILIYTHNTIPLLDTPGLQAPGQADAAFTRADRVTVQTVVD